MEQKTLADYIKEQEKAANESTTNSAIFEILGALKGIQLMKGADGTNGSDGENGKDGRNGSDGKDAVLPMKELAALITPLVNEIKSLKKEIGDMKDSVSPLLETNKKQEPRTVNSAAVRSRRTTQWKRFDNYDLSNIISAGDGITYFLPDSVIPNSETIRLNGATPLKNSDYTLSGNKLVFNNGNQSSSQIEVRAQTR